MEVKILREAGIDEALYGLGLSYGLTSAQGMDTVLYLRDVRNRLMKRAKALAKLGDGHNKFLRQMQIWIDIKAPLYWWKQMDQYKVATCTQSESTMHTLMKRRLTDADFEDGIMLFTLADLNARIDDADFDWVNRHLPQSFLQRRVLTCSYETVRNILRQRAGHKLKEWDVFCTAMKDLWYYNWIQEEECKSTE